MANEEQMLWKNKCHPYFKEKVKSSHHNCLSVLALHWVLIKWVFFNISLHLKLSFSVMVGNVVMTIWLWDEGSLHQRISNGLHPCSATPV